MKFFNDKNLYKKVIISILLILHFSCVISVQFYDLQYIKAEKIKNIRNFYIIPYFEQNWGMFAPSPPNGNQYFLIKFHSGNNSVVIDIHKKTKENSDKGLFNLDQRLLKYQNECYNDILNKLVHKKLSISFPDTKNSHGLQSILNYSKFSLKHQSEFLIKLAPNDIIYADVYLMDMPLNSYGSKIKFGNKKYILLPNIYLSNKVKLYD